MKKATKQSRLTKRRKERQRAQRSLETIRAERRAALLGFRRGFDSALIAAVAHLSGLR